MSKHQTRRVMQHSDFSLNEPSISVDHRFFKRFARAHSSKYSTDLNCSLDAISRAFHPRIAGYSSYECCKSFDYSYSEALKADPKLILRSLARLSELLDLSMEEVFKYCRLDSNLNWEAIHVPNFTEDKRVFWITLKNGKEMVVAADKKKTARELFGVSGKYFRENVRILNPREERNLYALANESKYQVLYRFENSEWTPEH